MKPAETGSIERSIIDALLHCGVTFERLDAFAIKKSDNGADVAFNMTQQGHGIAI